ncbi:MAG: hypothetical protein M1817_000275 [Caeruleum heppii]|nr:MAG: hypothetical protein M1817_000275 [Caeruleum heppii]
MARAKKDAEKSQSGATTAATATATQKKTPAIQSTTIAQAPAPPAASLQISVEDFVRTRDSVVTGLATLQSAVQDLSRAYIAHTDTVLGRAPGTTLGGLLTSTAFTTTLGGDTPLLGTAAAAPAAAAKADEPEVKEKKKKRAHDPNAPKRPLTPYFLYLQSARPVIRDDLGADAKPGDVGREGTRRWREMPEDQRKMWKVAYAKNLATYKTASDKYKALKLADPAAAQLAAENGAIDDDDDAEGEELLDADLDAEPPALPTPQPPAKSPKVSKSRKSGKETPSSSAAQQASATTAAPSSSAAKSSATNQDKGQSPDKKRKRAAEKKPKKAVEVSDEAPASAKKAAEKEKDKPAEKEKRVRKKRKSDAVGAAEGDA